MRARCYKDNETGKWAVFNEGKTVPVHCGSAYWFNTLEDLKDALRTKGIIVGALGFLGNKTNTLSAIFSWWDNYDHKN